MPRRAAHQKRPSSDMTVWGWTVSGHLRGQATTAQVDSGLQNFQPKTELLQYQPWGNAQQAELLQQQTACPGSCHELSSPMPTSGGPELATRIEEMELGRSVLDTLGWSDEEIGENDTLAAGSDFETDAVQDDDIDWNVENGELPPWYVPEPGLESTSISEGVGLLSGERP